ncbi:MAG: MBL fold metallo-hydrolase [FCB group bacterium]|nr:MBL fold metallo-hydrolase [FCB group bacterium]
MKMIRLRSETVFQENTYIVLNKEDALIIDPGAEPDVILAAVDQEKFKVRGILATHGHVDHLLAAAPLCKTLQCPFIMNSLDMDWLNALESMCGYYRLPYYGTPQIDTDIARKTSMNLGDHTFSIIHTPGHSSGSVCFLFADMLFSGDTLFRHSVGRTDLPGGDMKTLQHSIASGLLVLPEDTIVYPGHLDETNIKEEKLYNPFLVL